MTMNVGWLDMSLDDIRKQRRKQEAEQRTQKTNVKIVDKPLRRRFLGRQKNRNRGNKTGSQTKRSYVIVAPKTLNSQSMKRKTNRRNRQVRRRWKRGGFNKMQKKIQQQPSSNPEPKPAEKTVEEPAPSPSDSTSLGYNLTSQVVVRHGVDCREDSPDMITVPRPLELFPTISHVLKDGELTSYP